MMQGNKYLDDLGLKITEYGTNFISDDDERSGDWQKQREIYGFDSRECWNMDTKLIEWLYSHLMMYLEDASEIVDLTYYKFEHNGKTYLFFHGDNEDNYLFGASLAIIENFDFE